MGNRRTFLKQLGAGALAAAVPAGSFNATAGPVRSVSQPAAPRALRILILGGTGFVGPHLVKRALDRGHSVTTFTRGRTEPSLHGEYFSQVEQRIGDRNGDLTSLETGEWDVVIDDSGRNANWTRDSAQLLKDRAGRYMYTSSTGVYYPYLRDNVRESAPIEMDAGAEPNEDLAYGVMKANSEAEARGAFGDARTIVVRPTYIVGPGDRSDRFPYWPARLELGGTVLIPGQPDHPVQFIDVRDLVAFMILLLENGATGTFNAVCPPWEMGMRAFVHGVHAATSAPCEFVQVDDNAFLMEHGVPFAVPWIMPIEDNFGSARINNERAFAAGLTMRPLAVTAMDTLAWWHSDAVSEERRARMINDPDGLIQRESAILEAWKRRDGR